MGGHGGLNILPQKKWNVYNYDNRAIVDKDKKAAALKKKEEYQKSRSQKLGKKLQTLAGEIKSTEQVKDFMLPEMPNKSFNLFSTEEQIIKNNQLQEYKSQISEKFIKDQGIANDGMTIREGKLPWYAKKKGLSDQDKTRKINKWESIEAKKTDSIAISEYAELETNKKSLISGNQKRIKQDSELRQRSRQKNHSKKFQSFQKKSELDILREKRLKREKKQRQRAMKILKQ